MTTRTRRRRPRSGLVTRLIEVAFVVTLIVVGVWLLTVQVPIPENPGFSRN